MLNKINSIIDGLLNLWILLLTVVAMIFAASNTYQLSSNSFNKISEINNEIRKSSNIEQKEFEDREKLVYELNKHIDPSFFDEYYFLENYLIERGSFGGVFKLKNPSKLLISENELNLLVSIKNNSYSTKSEFEQEIRNLIGIENYKNHWEFISGIIDNTSYWKKIIFYFTIALFFILIIAKIVVSYIQNKQQKEKVDEELNESIIKAKKDIEEKPNKIIPVWDLANFTLQKYYNKNLSQIDGIYKLSIVVMLMGFVLIVSILISKTFYSTDLRLDSIGIVAGIITEFIGATFLFIYKSTITQALEHSKSLEDINNVGMSIKIIESISMDDNNKDKLDEAKIDIAKKLISSKSD